MSRTGGGSAAIHKCGRAVPNFGSQSPRTNDHVGAEAGIQKLTLTKIPRGVHVIKEPHHGRLADSSSRIEIAWIGCISHFKMIDVAEAPFEFRVLCQEHPALQTVDPFAFELVIAPSVHSARPE